MDFVGWWVGGWREENRGFCVQESHINSGTTLLPLKSWLIFEHKFRSSIFNDFGRRELILVIWSRSWTFESQFDQCVNFRPPGIDFGRS